MWKYKQHAKTVSINQDRDLFCLLYANIMKIEAIQNEVTICEKVGHEHVLPTKNKYSQNLLKPFWVHIGHKSVSLPHMDIISSIFIKCHCYLSTEPGHPVTFKKPVNLGPNWAKNNPNQSFIGKFHLFHFCVAIAFNIKNWTFKKNL